MNKLILSLGAISLVASSGVYAAGMTIDKSHHNDNSISYAYDIDNNQSSSRSSSSASSKSHGGTGIGVGQGGDSDASIGDITIRPSQTRLDIDNSKTNLSSKQHQDQSLENAVEGDTTAIGIEISRVSNRPVATAAALSLPGASLQTENAGTSYTNENRYTASSAVQSMNLQVIQTCGNLISELSKQNKAKAVEISMDGHWTFAYCAAAQHAALENMVIAADRAAELSGEGHTLGKPFRTLANTFKDLIPPSLGVLGGIGSGMDILK